MGYLIFFTVENECHFRNIATPFLNNRLFSPPLSLRLHVVEVKQVVRPTSSTAFAWTLKMALDAMAQTQFTRRSMVSRASSWIAWTVIYTARGSQGYWHPRIILFPSLCFLRPTIDTEPLWATKKKVSMVRECPLVIRAHPNHYWHFFTLLAPEDEVKTQSGRKTFLARLGYSNSCLELSTLLSTVCIQVLRYADDMQYLERFGPRLLKLVQRRLHFLFANRFSATSNPLLHL